jgi:hypothetical protein
MTGMISAPNIGAARCAKKMISPIFLFDNTIGTRWIAAPSVMAHSNIK